MKVRPGPGTLRRAAVGGVPAQGRGDGAPAPASQPWAGGAVGVLDDGGGHGAARAALRARWFAGGAVRPCAAFPRGHGEGMDGGAHRPARGAGAGDRREGPGRSGQPSAGFRRGGPACRSPDCAAVSYRIRRPRGRRRGTAPGGMLPQSLLCTRNRGAGSPFSRKMPALFRISLAFSAQDHLFPLAVPCFPSRDHRWLRR